MPASTASKSKAAIRVLIADDHPVVRAGLISMLATYPDLEVVGGVSDGNKTMALLEKKKVDVLLLDLRMPGMSGLEVLEALKQLKSPPRVIVLTSYESDDNIYDAIRSGTQGYLLKACSEEEMIEAIHAVHAGERYLPPHIATRFADRVPRAHLSSQQNDVLEHISAGLADYQVARRLRISVSEVWESLNQTIESLDRLEKARGDSPQARRPTMADIARKAGVSMATVSRVLHNKGMHTEDTRRAVMKVVREYNFQLNDTAATLAMMRNPPSEE